MGNFTHNIPYVSRHVTRSGAHWRRETYRYRRVVPPDVRSAFQRANGRKRLEWVKTWPARTHIALIEREARALARHHDAMIARARAGEVLAAEIVARAEAGARSILALPAADRYDYLSIMGGDDLHPEVAATINAIEHGGTYMPERLTLTAAHERDRERYGGGRDEKPIMFAVGSFVAAAGDKDVRAITRADVADWLAGMEQRGMAPATVKRRLGALRAMVNRAFLDMDHAARNPFAQHAVKDGGGKADDVLPFSKAMLEKIDAHLTGGRLGHETQNIVRMMRGTGAGPAEIGGLALADVSLDSDIPFIWIRRNSIRGLKSKAARDRRVPLIGEALDAARDACRRAKFRSKGKPAESVPLFTGFRSDRGADSISAKVNKAIRSAGVPKSCRLVAYSFRHSMKEALRSAGAADHVQRRLLGHAGEGVADRYGSPAARLAEARDALTAAMEHLGDVDTMIYRADERLA